MKKIAFSDRYGLTQAVLEDRKTMTRRIIKGGYEKITAYSVNNNWVFLADIEDDCIEIKPLYEIGEKVAVAQRYKDVIHQCDWVGKELYQDHPGYSNKMFVKAEYMPYRIRITNIKLERLQDISDEDCMREGIMEGEFMNTWDTFYFDQWGDVPNHITFKTPREAFAALIDRISGRGTWKRNPWVYAYSFELVKEEEQ